VLSKAIISEFEQVLNYDEIQNKNLEMKRTVRKIISISKIIEPIGRLEIIKDDPSDNIILECALDGDVDYIISRDKHLLRLEEFKGIRILTPEEFLGIFEV